MASINLFARILFPTGAMATQQKLPNSMISLGVLRKALLNPQGSRVLLRVLTSNVVSSVLYHRLDFDQSDFEQHSYAGSKYYAFKSKVENAELRYIKLWMLDVMDAINNSYLKELHLTFANKNNPNTILESYKIQYKYHDENSEPNVIFNQLQTTFKQLLSAVDRLSLLESKFPPKDIVIQMALTYNKDTTPPDYHPKYLRPEEGEKSILDMINEQPPIYYNIGIVMTNHHTVKSRGRGAAFGHSEPKETEAFNTAQDNVVEELPMDICNIEEENTTSASKIPDSDIRCFCNKNRNFNEIPLIYCSNCKTWQHSPCAGFLYTDNIPPEYSCLRCEKKEQKQPQVFAYRLIIAYAFITDTFPDEILKTFTKEEQQYFTGKLCSSQLITGTQHGYNVNRKRIQLISSVVFTEDSASKPIVQQIPDSMTLESQTWSPVLGPPKITKRTKQQ